MLVSMNKLRNMSCHVLHVLQATTYGIIFSQTFVSVSKEASLIPVARVLGNKRRSICETLFLVRPKTVKGRKKRKKKTKKAISKLFALDANAIN